MALERRDTRGEREPALTVYTAQIQAQSVGIGDDPREILVGSRALERCAFVPIAARCAWSNSSAGRA